MPIQIVEKAITKAKWEKKFDELIKKKYAWPYLMQCMVQHILSVDKDKEALQVSLATLNTEKMALETKIAELDTRLKALEVK